MLPSNCYSKNRISVDGAVVHYISAKNINPNDPFNVNAAIDILKNIRLSYKGLITREGEYIELVPENFKQYHAGYSIMNGREDCNSFTNGYALIGGSAWEYEYDQILKLGEVLAKDMTANNYSLDWIKGHDEVRAEWRDKYPDRVKYFQDKNQGYKVSKKYDPGAHFKMGILKDMLYSVSEV